MLLAKRDFGHFCSPCVCPHSVGPGTGLIDGCMDGWGLGVAWMDGWMDGCMQVGEWVIAWMNRGMDGWMDGQTDG